MAGSVLLGSAPSMSGTCLTLTIAAGFATALISPVLVYAENKDKPRPRGFSETVPLKRTRKKQRLAAARLDGQRERERERVGGGCLA